MRILLKSIFILGTVILVSSSCKKEKDFSDIVPKIDTTKLYKIPTTYNFSNVNISGQLFRINMVNEITDYIESAEDDSVILDSQKMLEMYINVNSRFSSSTLNNCGKQIKNKVYFQEQSILEQYLNDSYFASLRTVSASNGQPGVITSNDGTKKYLVDSNGFDIAENFGKGCLGALAYYQICEIYLSPDKIGNGVDNSNVVPGEGTAMEHHWDEAFGYLGVTIDFPTNTSTLYLIGEYVNGRNTLLNCSKTIMDAFIKGRAAISNKDYETRDQQVVIIKSEIEKVMAATAISYLNKAKSFISDNAIRSHTATEAVGFIKALKYNSSKRITDEQLSNLLSLIGPNLYTVSSDNLTAARDLLSSIYNLETIKALL